MSTLQQAVQDYIEMRRGLGFKLREAGRGLIDFVAFLEANDTQYVTTDLALAWAQRPSHAQPAHWATRLGYVRGFARHRAAADPRTQLPPNGLLPFRPKRARPYLYSKEDIQRLGGGNLILAVLRMHRDREAPRCEKTVPALFGRWCLDRPREDAVCTDDLITVGFCVGNKVAQEQRLAAELEPKGVVKTYMSIQILTKHHASPGQG